VLPDPELWFLPCQLDCLLWSNANPLDKKIFTKYCAETCVDKIFQNHIPNEIERLRTAANHLSHTHIDWFAIRLFSRGSHTFSQWWIVFLVGRRLCHWRSLLPPSVPRYVSWLYFDIPAVIISDRGPDPNLLLLYVLFCASSWVWFTSRLLPTTPRPAGLSSAFIGGSKKP
jgi:hypothetical protein